MPDKRHPQTESRKQMSPVKTPYADFMSLRTHSTRELLDKEVDSGLDPLGPDVRQMVVRAASRVAGLRRSPRQLCSHAAQGWRQTRNDQWDGETHRIAFCTVLEHLALQTRRERPVAEAQRRVAKHDDSLDPAVQRTGDIIGGGVHHSRTLRVPHERECLPGTADGLAYQPVDDVAGAAEDA